VFILAAWSASYYDLVQLTDVGVGPRLGRWSTKSGFLIIFILFLDPVSLMSLLFWVLVRSPWELDIFCEEGEDRKQG
jgi:hypothetical protein